MRIFLILMTIVSFNSYAQDESFSPIVKFESESSEYCKPLLVYVPSTLNDKHITSIAFVLGNSEKQDLYLTSTLLDASDFGEYTKKNHHLTTLCTSVELLDKLNVRVSYSHSKTDGSISLCSTDKFFKITDAM